MVLGGYTSRQPRSWIAAIGEAPHCAVASSGENGGVAFLGQANRDAQCDALEWVRLPCSDALMMQAAQRPTPAAISDVTCRLANYTCAQGMGSIGVSRIRGVDGGTCLAVAHWGVESALRMGGIKNLHPVTRNASLVCPAGARAKFSSTP